MNLVSAVVGLSIMGIAAPTVLEMSVTPIKAQKRASNFAKAESAAVTYAAANEGAPNPPDPDPKSGCKLERTNAPAYEIHCTAGRKQFVAAVSRSFIGELPNNNVSNSGPFPYPINPYGTNGHQCLDTENWGLSGTYSNWDPVAKEWTAASCVPSALFTQKNFDDSHPRDWLWDINRLNNRGYHKNYDEYVSSS